MKVLITLAVLTMLVAMWVTWLRPKLRDRPWWKPFFDWIEPYEIWLYKKSESILWARFLQGLGAVLSAITYMNLDQLYPLVAVLPAGYGWVVVVAPWIVSAAGWLNERLRKDISTSLEVVALPNNAPPEVKAVVADAEVANKIAVAAVAEAKAEAKV